MRWTDDAILLSAKPFAEKGLIVTCLTETHGLYRGFLRSRRHQPLAQPGTMAQATWVARLREHLGTWTLETQSVPLAGLLDDPLQLLALQSACSLIEACIPEREKTEGVYPTLQAYIQQAPQSTWRQAYLDFEKEILKLMGFPLSLEACVATGVQEELIYISPKSGGAVSCTAGRPYHDQLFAFPEALKGKTNSLQGLGEALTLLGYFLGKFVLSPHGAELPSSRRRLQERVLGQSIKLKQSH